ncbi:MAG: hypothetical protein DI570_07980 [Phenylobacterium zucineum]|nr:MAG: hypothetical protein DI570_07980 [Phenylobacterium zucineum]
MKRLLLTLAAVASVATTLPLGETAWAQGRGRGAERQERGPDRGRGEERRGGPDRERGDDRGRGRRGDEARQRDARAAFGYERRDRDERRGARWDDDEPPRAAARRGYDAPAPAARQRGFAPQAYRGPVVEDFRRYRLRPPPHGYAWVRMGDGFALISLDDGQVFDRVR